MNQLDNQIAVVTGAGRGIGRAIALKFAAEGADVVVVSRTAENSRGKVAAKSARWAARPGPSPWTWPMPPPSSAAAEKILAEAGKVDILVNNAGVTRDGLLMRMSEADWDTVLDTNFKGAFLFTKAFQPRVRSSSASGRIINISSVIGLIGNAGPVQLRGQQGGLDRVHQVGARANSPRGASRSTPSRRDSSRRT